MPECPMSDNDLTIHPCPASSNCVSSQSRDSHFIEPFPVTGDMKAAFDRLKEIFEKRSDTTVTATDGKIGFRK